MTDTPKSADKNTPPKKTPPGDRIAKVLSRAGISSRREAEAMIEEGRVMVNGRVVASPALNVLPKDKIFVDGKEVGEPEPPRLWLYHKPLGLVTTAKDEKGRDTVFDQLPKELPRVMSVGRLDLNSEGLLLLTNDGELKRKLELPDTGWLRKYRVRVKGTASEATLEPLRKGVTIDGEHFQPMEVTFDRQQGANAWLTIGLREGRNREIRRAMEHVGLTVNRLIRLSYGPFRLGTLQPGQVEEVRARVLRDQLGMDLQVGEGGMAKRTVMRGDKPGGPRKEVRGRDDARGPKQGRDDRGGKPPFKGKRDDRDGFKPRGEGFKGKPRDGYKRRDDDDGKPGGFKPRGEGFKGKPRDGKPGGKPGQQRDGKPSGKPSGKPGGFKSHGFKSHGGGDGGKPRSAGFKSHGGNSAGRAGGAKGGKPPKSGR
ncbi:pseudouridine synthase [Celeribacter halophilus]|uniref:Pseudouridine synthase n=1 Tax=Celeribacter halophilus TaxID=576117 RepID=A0A1I3UDI5_9RHOB|nr:pseudouridine synthase [Celeribacter halophilus]PZX10433.1 23S rRNA pseudouridine2605 synthase [Celeribacter halophilus]SFJ81564.1 23S rRNA pseudouridine2605 synthase [Celeribacter halophilus]